MLRRLQSHLGQEFYSSSSSQKVKALEDFDLEMLLSNIILQDLCLRRVTRSVWTSQHHRLNSTLGKLPPHGSSHCECRNVCPLLLVLCALQSHSDTREIKILSMKTLNFFFSFEFGEVLIWFEGTQQRFLILDTFINHRATRHFEVIQMNQTQILLSRSLQANRGGRRHT